MTINYDTPASLRRWTSLEKKRSGDASMFGSSQIWEGTLAGCIRQFLDKPKSRQPLYDIMLSEEAGIGKTILGPSDIIAICQRDDWLATQYTVEVVLTEEPDHRTPVVQL